jgi:hypothetical protein
MQDNPPQTQPYKAAISGPFGHAGAAMLWCIDQTTTCSRAKTDMPITTVEFGVFVY